MDFVSVIGEHEELKESVVLCMGDLFKNSTTSIIEEFYQKKYAALISHGVYICVLIARLEKSISLRWETFNQMSKFCLKLRSLDLHNLKKKKN